MSGPVTWPTVRRLSMFSDDELRAELDRRARDELRDLLLHAALHNSVGDLQLAGDLPAELIAQRLRDTVPAVEAWARRWGR